MRVTKFNPEGKNSATKILNSWVAFRNSYVYNECNKIGIIGGNVT